MSGGSLPRALTASESAGLPGASNKVSVNILLWALRFYRAVFSPLMPFGCKFYPSCSQYASEAIARHGALRGTRLAALRLLRCRPFTRGGFDPVPDAPERLSEEGYVHTHETPAGYSFIPHEPGVSCTCSPRHTGAGYTYSSQDRTDLHS